MAVTALEDLISRCLERYETDGAAGVEAIISTRPELADQVRTALRELGCAGLLELAGQHFDLPDRLGDYRIRERIGGGGMGVVHRAEQESLSRDVAIKVIRPELLPSETARLRFEREVAAIASLEHENIVRVYEVGADSGQPFFAMELIDGATLGDCIARLRGRDPSTLTGRDLLRAIETERWRASGRSMTTDSVDDRDGQLGESAAVPAAFRGSYEDAVLAVLSQLAAALEHAHSRGIVHRDVKPSNVLLTPTGRALLFDFGLQHDKRDVRLTNAQPVGSPAYMAPERVLNSEVGASADVWGLGITLFEALTLELPFVAGDRHGLEERILAAEPPRPRRLNSATSWEAETICLGALQRDLTSRYPSASAFAADVERQLRREPILAKRPSALRRLRRWCERRPAVAVATVLGALLLVGTPTLLYLREQRAAERIAGEATRAQNNLELALRAVRNFVERFERDVMAQMAVVNSETYDRLTEAVGLYASLDSGGDESASRAVLWNAAFAQRGLAVASLELGRLEGAERAARESVRLFGLEPIDDRGRAELAAALRTLAIVLFEREGTSRVAEGDRSLARALDVFRELDSRDQLLPLARENFAVALDLKVSRDMSAKAYERAQRHSQKALEILETAAKSSDAGAHTLYLRGHLTSRLAVLQFRQGRLDDAEGTLALAKQRVDAVLADTPSATNCAWLRARIANQLSDCASVRAKYAEALEQRRDAAGRYRALIADNPNNPRLRRSYALTLSKLGELLGKRRKKKEALEQFALATEQYELLEKRGDRMTSRAFRLHLHRCASHAYVTADLRRAKQLVERSIALAAEHDGADMRYDLSRCWTLMYRIASRRRRHDSARACLERSLELLERLITEHPEVATYARDHARNLHSYGVVWARTKQPAKAESWFRRAVTAKRSLLDKLPGHDSVAAIANSELDLSHALLVQGKTKLAREAAARAVKGYEEVHGSAPRLPLYLRRLADAYDLSAQIALAGRDPDRALALARRVTKLAAPSDSLFLRSAIIAARSSPHLDGSRRASAIDLGFELLEHALSRGLRERRRVEQNKAFAALHADPRWAKFLRKLEG